MKVLTQSTQNQLLSFDTFREPIIAELNEWEQMLKSPTLSYSKKENIKSKLVIFKNYDASAFETFEALISEIISLHGINKDCKLKYEKLKRYAQAHGLDTKSVEWCKLTDF